MPHENKLIRTNEGVAAVNNAIQFRLSPFLPFPFPTTNTLPFPVERLPPSPAFQRMSPGLTRVCFLPSFDSLSLGLPLGRLLTHQTERPGSGERQRPTGTRELKRDADQTRGGLTSDATKGWKHPFGRHSGQGSLGAIRAVDGKDRREYLVRSLASRSHRLSVDHRRRQHQSSTQNVCRHSNSLLISLGLSLS